MDLDGSSRKKVPRVAISIKSGGVELKRRFMRVTNYEWEKIPWKKHRSNKNKFILKSRKMPMKIQTEFNRSHLPTANSIAHTFIHTISTSLTTTTTLLIMEMNTNSRK